MVMKFLLRILAFTPLVFLPGVFYPYVTAKVVFLRAIICFVAILFFGKLLFNNNFRSEQNQKLKKLLGNKIFLSACVFFLSYVLSAIFAVSKIWAFFGTFEKGEGVVGMLFFFGF